MLHTLTHLSTLYAGVFSAIPVTTMEESLWKNSEFRPPSILNPQGWVTADRSIVRVRVS